MKSFYRILKKEYKKVINNKFILFILLLAPLIFSAVVIWTFSKGVATDLPVAVVDNDNSDLSREISRMIDATSGCAVKYKIADIEQGHNLIKKGSVYALIVIPRDFKKDLNRSQKPQIVYYYNNQAILIGGVITKDVQSAVLTVMSGVNAQIQMKKGLPKDVVLSKINLIRVDEHIKANPYLNYSYFLTYAALAHVFQVFITFLAIWSVGIEFKEGTIRKSLKLADDSIIVLAFAKMTFYAVIFLIQMLIVYGYYILVYGAPFDGNLLFCLLSTIAFIFSYESMGIAFVSVLSNLRFALSAGAFYTSLGFTMAGMTFPAIAMPSFGQMYSALLPVRPFVNLLVDQSMKGLDVVYDIKYLFWILLIFLLGISLLPLLKKHAKDESLWYQI